MIPVTILAVLLLAAVLAPVVYRFAGDRSGALLALIPGGLFVLLLGQVNRLASGEVLAWSLPWAPLLGLSLDVRIDGLSMLMLLLITGIGALILIYTSGYLSGDERQGRLLGLLLFFMAAMVGMVSTDNLIAIFVFWELTSFASYLLIGFNHEDKTARQSALQALLVTGAGGLALLAGIILLGQIAGTYAVSSLAGLSGEITQHPLYLVVLMLVFAGAFTKSAQVPFHFWLPQAMAAPTPVSAYLHSATMVNAGVFLLAKLNPVLGGTAAWHYVLMIVGVVTMLVGAALALPQTDLKRLLAYSTVSALGTLTLLIGLGTKESVKAAVVFLIVHSLYKGALFMVAGAVDHGTGTRDVRALTGLWRNMPMVALAAGLAALSMSGFPPLLGFIGKELLYEAKLQAPAVAGLITWAGVSANVMMVAVAITVGIRPFLGKPPQGPAHTAPLVLWLGPILLAAAGLGLGFFPALLGSAVIEPAMVAIQGAPVEIHLKLWHGINLVFLLSMATLLGGLAVFALRKKIRRLAASFHFLSRVGPTALYEDLMAGLMAVATLQTRWLQHGRLRLYVLTVVGVSLVGVFFGLTQFGKITLGMGATIPTFFEIAVAVVVLVAAGLVVTTSSRLTALLGLGVIGYGVALFFLFYGAPDLAITQILVETLTLLLFVLIIGRLPRFVTISTPRRRVIDGILALLGGGVMTALVLKAVHVDSGEPISNYFVENALTAHGRNIVNVILVDFRAMDTLGEIVVVVMAALGVATLMKQKSKGGRAK